MGVNILPKYYLTASWLQFEPRPFCAWVHHANRWPTEYRATPEMFVTVSNLTVFIEQLVQFYSNNTTNVHHLTHNYVMFTDNTNTSRRSSATSTGSEFKSGYTSASVYWRSVVWTLSERHRPPYLADGIRRATAVVTSACRLSSSRPFVDPRSATGLALSSLHGRGTVCRRPS